MMRFGNGISFQHIHNRYDAIWNVLFNSLSLSLSLSFVRLLTTKTFQFCRILFSHISIWKTRFFFSFEKKDTNHVGNTTQHNSHKLFVSLLHCCVLLSALIESLVEQAQAISQLIYGRLYCG